MKNKSIYREFCKNEITIPIFSQDWWLDLVSNNEWDVCLVDKDQEILAAMPYVIKKSYGFNFITMPSLTQNLGPWLKKSHSKYSKKLSQEKDLMYALIDQLPKYDYFLQNWHHNSANWLPFHWRGFEASTRYTYVIENLSDIDNVWNNMQENIKYDIRKANNKVGLKVRSDLPIDDFIDLNQMTFDRQKIAMPYSRNFIRNLIKDTKRRNQCKWFVGQDKHGKNHAGVLIVWDSESAYYLMGGGNPDLRISGATSLCMWEAIKFASTLTNKFDFEGSMIESIERFFRGFGSVQKPYFQVTQKPSKILHGAYTLKKIFKF